MLEVFNACFGNLYDPVAVLKHVAQELLSEGGLVVGALGKTHLVSTLF